MLFLLFILFESFVQQTCICIYMHWFTQMTLPPIMAHHSLSQIHNIVLTARKAALRLLLWDWSTFKAELYICPFIGTIALVKTLIGEYPSIASFVCHVLSILALPITMVPPPLLEMTGLLVPLVHSSFWTPHVNRSNTARVINSKQGLTNKRC